MTLVARIDNRVEGGHELARILATAPNGGDRTERVDVRVVEIEHAVVVGEGLLVAAELLEEDPGRGGSRPSTRKSSESAMSNSRSSTSQSSAH